MTTTTTTDQHHAMSPATTGKETTMAPSNRSGAGNEPSGYINHVVAETVRRQVLDSLSSPRPKPFITLVGGAGAGKSTLLDLLYREAVASAAPAMAADPSTLPVARGKVPAPTSARFNWHAFADAIRQAFRLPAASLTALRPDGRRVHGRQARNSHEALGDAIEDVRLRGGKVLFLDEGNHLGVMADQKRADIQFDALKDFAAETGLTLVLVGTYDLLKLPHASAQLGRRTDIAHLRPYDLRVEKDRVEFTRIVGVIAREVGDTLPIDDAWVEELHAGSAGCVGLLIDWLLNAAHVHHLRGRSNALRSTIRAKRWPAPYLAEVRAELLVGSQSLDGSGDRRWELAEAHGVAASQAGVARDRSRRRAPVTANGQVLKPGERRPRRIPLTEAA